MGLSRFIQKLSRFIQRLYPRPELEIRPKPHDEESTLTGGSQRPSSTAEPQSTVSNDPSVGQPATVDSLSNNSSQPPPAAQRNGPQLLPYEADCVVNLVYGGEEHRALERRIWWQENTKYAELEHASIQWLQEHLSIPETTHLYQKSGICRLINCEQQSEFASRILENEEQWSEVLSDLITSFVPKHAYVKFRLEFLWKYSGLSIQRVSDEEYATTVRNAIHSKFQTNWQDQKFLPRKDLLEIFSENTIRELINDDKSLGRIANLDVDSFVQDISDDACRLLAICVWAKLPLECLYRLMAQGYIDVHLPLKKSHCPNGHEVDFENFRTWQGSFIAHAFQDDRGRPEHLSLPREVVVPIMFNETIDLLGEGGFGRVYKVQIDPDHHLFSVDREQWFALKRFKELGAQAIDDFKNELKALSEFSETAHPNITGHLASWTQKDTFYMLLPCAKTNLAEFLRNEPHPKLTNENVHWLLSQLQGLAEGMRRIHNLNPGFGPATLTADNQLDRKPRRLGFHHDIKPQNILLFANDNVKDRDPPMTQLHCKISDFGAARIHEVLSQPKAKESPQHSSLVRGDPVYGAPDRAIKKKTSRPYDVWSLGCVFLEILLWTFGLEGCDLAEFEEERAKDYGSRTGRFWRETGEGKIKLKESVLKRLKQLEDHCKDRGVFERLVRLTRKMLSVEPVERPEAPQICNDLETFLIQSKHDFQKHDFYRHDISAHVEIAAPPSSDGGSRSPSIDERSIYAFGKGSLPVDTIDRGRLWSRDENDVEQDPYRLSSDMNQRDPSRPRHAQRPSSIDIYGPGAQSPSSQIFIEDDVGGEVPHPPLGSHQISIEREDLMHPARPRAIPDGAGGSYSHQ